jgi:hypothetical protein
VIIRRAVLKTTASGADEEDGTSVPVFFLGVFMTNVIIGRRIALFTFLGLTLTAVLFSANSHPSLDNMGMYHPLHEDLSFDPEDYSEGWIVNDENLDGIVDYGIYFNDEGIKVYEAADFNKDGLMDDFYFYEEGVLVRQEIDQNADGKIDLWVYLSEGVYVEGYERDSDFDGLIDVVKLYGEQE